MKIEKFLTWIQEKMLYYPNIDFATIKMFISQFNKCLSKNERERWSLTIQIINELTSKQLTIDEIIHREKTKQLDNQLIQLKNEVKPK